MDLVFLGVRETIERRASRHDPNAGVRMGPSRGAMGGIVQRYGAPLRSSEGLVEPRFLHRRDPGDLYGNTNLIGSGTDYKHLKFRASRIGGDATLSTHVGRYYIVLNNHSPRVLVEKCDYISAYGWGSGGADARQRLGIPGGGQNTASLRYASWILPKIRNGCGSNRYIRESPPKWSSVRPVSNRISRRRCRRPSRRPTMNSECCALASIWKDDCAGNYSGTPAEVERPGSGACATGSKTVCHQARNHGTPSRLPETCPQICMPSGLISASNRVARRRERCLRQSSWSRYDIRRSAKMHASSRKCGRRWLAPDLPIGVCYAATFDPGFGKSHFERTVTGAFITEPIGLRSPRTILAPPGARWIESSWVTSPCQHP